MRLLSSNTEGGSSVNQYVRPATLLVVVSLLAVGLFAAGVAAHGEDADLVVHNQTQVLDEHDEVHTITVDAATAATEFYLDVHTEAGDRNKTATFEAGTTVENLDLELDPTITEDTTVTVATHAANGTELEAQEITVEVVDAPTVEFADQIREADEHEEVHTITVDTVAANEEYYVDVHTEAGDRNKTATFEAGTAQTDLELSLEPPLTNTTNVTVAVHAANGTELAAQSATVTVEDAGGVPGTETGEATETATSTRTEGASSGGTDEMADDSTEDDGAGFGVVGALVAVVTAVAGRRVAA